MASNRRLGASQRWAVLGITIVFREKPLAREEGDITMANQPIALPKNGNHTEVGRPEVTRGVSYTPRVDIRETEEELTLFADLPGAKSEDVDVRFENGELCLQARCPARQQGTSYLLSEYGVGDFYRAFPSTRTSIPTRLRRS
jgi:HSP20 family molecular chaperone IbpA